MPAPTFTLTFPEPDIALLTMDMADKGANVLSLSMLQELSGQLDVLEPRSELAGLILSSGKPGQFVAGADLREFAASLEMPAEQVAELCRDGQDLFARLSACPFVTVAAIGGICLGGGAELAAWCDRRVMSDHPKVEFGFPEVKLGLFPGWGGTMRAPRMVGLGNAVEMISGGESIRPAAARAMGWASDVVPDEQLLEAAIGTVRAEQETKQYLVDRQRWSAPLDISETELAFLGATASAYIQQQTRGNYPAPMAALEVMLGGAHLDGQGACQLEAEGMAQLFGSPVNAALLNVFFLTDRNKKDPGVDTHEFHSHKIQSVAVVGAGIMGAGIAAANIKRELRVCMTDTRSAALAAGVQKVLEEVSYNRETKQQDLERAVKYAPLVNPTSTDAEIADCDLVIEAVIEDEHIKKELYARLEPQMAPDAILATNTSTIPITHLAAGLRHPERFCGIHFFNPVRRMKLVEVIRGAQTNDDTVATAVAYAKRIGKSPIVINDGPGFLVNRLLMPYMNEALELLASGVPVKDIDRAARKFGMPVGPFELYDMVGLDTAIYAGTVLCAAFPERFSASPILPALVAAGRLGRKSGHGFYAFDKKGKRTEPDPQLAPLLTPHIHAGERRISPEEITNRMFLLMLIEGALVLEEHIVRNARDVDLAMIFGTGFPPFKGGLLYWADTLGAAQILEMLKPLEALGPRFSPPALLLELAQNEITFYDV